MISGVDLAALFLFSACATTLPALPGDENLVIKASDLAKLGLELPPDYAKHEHLRRDRDSEGELIAYDFQVEKLLVKSIASVRSKQGTGCKSFDEANEIVDREFAAHERLRLVEDSAAFRAGEKSRFGRMEREGKPVGNAFQACWSRTYLLATFVGVYVGDAETFAELVTPVLDALDAYERKTAPPD